MIQTMLRLTLFVPLLAVAAEWSSYGGPGGRQHTPLQQIAPENVATLTEVWRVRTGDLSQGFRRKGHSFQANPVIWDGKLFISTSGGLVLALDARTGAEVWRFDVGLPKDAGYSESASRGVSLWHGDVPQCPNRVFVGTLVGEVLALDARTGGLCPQFGTGGRVDLSRDARATSIGDYGVTSPPAVIGDLLIVGSAIGDNRAVQSELGIVRALDAISGEEHWRWDPIPRDPDDEIRQGWGGRSADITGSANAWAPLLADAEAGVVFVSTSSPSPDFYGGERVGDNRHANSLVALQATTGQVLWFRQLVHHDVWDYDVPVQPTRFSLRRDGAEIPAVAVATKTGQFFAFHRDTGEPLFGFEERPIPGSDIPGEKLSPTQPYSRIPPLVNQQPLSEEDAFGLLFFDRLACADDIARYRSEGVFTPPSFEGSLMNPGYPGGVNWGGVSIDEQRQIAVVNANQMAVIVQLIDRDAYAQDPSPWEGGDWQVSPMEGTPYLMARRVFLSFLGLPCIKPPWGKLVAVDLQNEQILWSEPLGTIADLAPAPVPNFAWGVPAMGGSLLTASGLVVIGAAAEHTIRAFDTQSGTQLWEAALPAAAISVPMSYELDGRQFIVVTAGGHSQLGLERGDYVVAFALPE